MSKRRPNSKRRQAKSQSNNRILQFSIIALVAVGIIAGIVFWPSLQADTSQAQTAPISQVNSNQVSQVELVSNRASSNPYEGIPGPDSWTAETPVQIYNRLNGTWEDKTYGDVGPDMEFIVGDYVYATTPENGVLFLKPELDLAKLAETDQAFDPGNWRMPKPDDIIFLFKSGSQQQKGHWLLKDVQPDSEIVFQGKVWSWELDLENQRFVVKDTGNVFAKVTDTHKAVHEGDVLALTVRYESCGKLGLITGSEEHPFYVLEKEDYIPMVELKPGMELKTDNGTQATVVELKPLPETMELYNLTVENVHNYYIFSSEDDPGVLVHNIGPCLTTAGGRRIDPNHVGRIFNERGFADWELDNAIDNFDDFLLQDDGAGIHLVKSGRDTFDVVVTGTGDDNFIVTAYRGLTQKELDRNIASGVWSR
ncbi:MAG: hypothetical protein GFH27_549307n211 [Chloroflexi bacterium AL-W]|nr:hypothetical protein [Chloroflexi bacterium AL-N1]NOK69244.1 hypothetical protein [Chloroflexi bacterium AL-N10]NOK77227.1 hypothetical protein [Chloroflexi bacterium AL-N5]NOK83871.1 hypothetical protein [Chloroflexi bacterium AL-W]NOK91082.1 hypothetical protein [Chloroflexi bacterium AL-N15]